MLITICNKCKNKCYTRHHYTNISLRINKLKHWVFVSIFHFSISLVSVCSSFCPFVHPSICLFLLSYSLDPWPKCHVHWPLFVLNTVFGQSRVQCDQIAGVVEVEIFPHKKVWLANCLHFVLLLWCCWAPRQIN